MCCSAAPVLGDYAPARCYMGDCKSWLLTIFGSSCFTFAVIVNNQLLKILFNAAVLH